VLAAAGALAALDVEDRGHLAPALCLAAIALAVMHVVRLSVDISWVGFRGGQLLLVCAPALAASLFVSARWRPVAGWLGLAALIMGFPTLLIDTYNAQDITNLAAGPGFPWTEVLDVAHLQALDWVRRNTPPDATVQLDPIARGRTTWSIIPSFAHRRMAAGLPPTLVDEPEYHERSERVRTMFATRDAREAWDVAHALRIDYIWVDDAERRAYPDGLAKFANAPQYFARAFEDSEVTIYRVE
jgi:hypothetical protein